MDNVTPNGRDKVKCSFTEFRKQRNEFTESMFTWFSITPKETGTGTVFIP